MDKKIALVTGAARGLGESIARKMHAAGYKVALADIDLEQVSAVAASLDASGATAMPLALDVRRKPDFIAACDAIELRWGGAAVLVNNAGRSRVAALMEITPEEWDEVTAINMKGTFLACQVFGKRFADRGYGRIINIASPGPLDLPIVREIVPADKLAATIATIPVKTLGEPDFIADAVLLLASPDAGSATGACLDINGGLYMR